jgi:hypothetical protein
MTSTARSFLALALAVVGSTLALGCTIQHEKVEKSIREKFEEDDVAFDSIKCPKNVKLKKGGEFECEGETSLGDTFTVSVEQKDDRGSIEWELQGRIVDPKEIAKKSGGLVDCGKEKVIAVKGTKLSCREGDKKVVLKFKNDKGDFDVETK